MGVAVWRRLGVVGLAVVVHVAAVGVDALPANGSTSAIAVPPYRPQGDAKPQLHRPTGDFRNWPRWGDGSGGAHGGRGRAHGPTGATATAAAALSGPPESTPTSPANKAVLMTTTPTLTSSAVAGVSYGYRVATGADGVSGQLLDSGWQPSPSWQVPSTSLQDGFTYYWTALTFDGTSFTRSTAIFSFTVNLRLGNQPSNPIESLGDFQFNLANGNHMFRHDSPRFATVGGPVGVSFNYNENAPSPDGLSAAYFNNCGTGPSPSFPAQPALVRRDPEIFFHWYQSNTGTVRPAPNVDLQHFCVQWTGYITVPDTATYYFDVAHADGARLWLNNTLYIDNWADVPAFQSAPDDVTPGIALSASQSIPITLQFYQDQPAVFENGEDAQIFLGETESQGVGALPVDSTWLSSSLPSLPPHWSLSTDDGRGLRYSSITVGTNELVLNEPSGAVHQYIETDSSGLSWRPSDDDGGVVSLEPASNHYQVLGADGFTYQFDANGKLIDARSPQDDLHPAAPTYTYDGARANLTKITDPVTNRFVTFAYSQAGTTCPKLNSGDPQPDPGMLCSITYWDGTKTNIYYDPQYALLTRITDPGNSNNVAPDRVEQNDFAYLGAVRIGRLVAYRSPMANDAVAAGLRTLATDALTNPAHDDTATYSFFNTIRLPAPMAGADRTEHDITYDSATQSSVTVVGLGANPARRVTFDAGGNVLTDRDAAGLVTTSTWTAKDNLASRITPDGLEATTIYDSDDRPTDRYGPAPQSCFNQTTLTPNGSCTNPAVPHATTAYDEGIFGLAATYWDNVSLAGPAKTHSTGVGDPTGALNHDWSTTPPANIPATNWSARFTGNVLLPLTGVYSFQTFADDGTRVWVDDTLVAQDWAGGAAHFAPVVATITNTTANSRHRIRVDYFQGTGPASIALYWTPPGGSRVTVPGADLGPRYGMVTTAIDPDGRKTVTNYGTRPEFGLSATTTQDPGGPNSLTTTTVYETPPSGYLRVLQTIPPGGSTKTVTNTYYANSGDTVFSNTCGGIVGPGLPKTITEPDPDGTGPQQPIVRQYVYDALNRPVGTRTSTDTNWSCVSYDARGRVTSSTDSLGRATTNTYMPLGVTTTYTDSAGSSRTVATSVDLLGRQIQYRDENNWLTHSTYDQVGRLTGTTRNLAGNQTPTQVTSMTFDPTNGRLTAETEYLSGVGRTTTFGYDSVGRPQTTTRPNGTSTTTAYDPNLGQVSSLSNKHGAAEFNRSDYTFSSAGRVKTDAMTGRSPRSYTYDSVGRLFSTVEGGTTRNFRYYSSDTNRCSTTTTCDGSYTYDNADRLLSSPVASAYTYDAHGNVTAEVQRNQAPPLSIAQSAPFDGSSTGPISIPFTSVGSGPFNASVDWTTPTVSTANPSVHNTLAPGTNTSTPTFVYGKSTLNGTVTWPGVLRSASTTTSNIAIPAGGSTTRSITSAAAQPITATLDWSPVQQTIPSSQPTAPANTTSDAKTFTVTGNGRIHGQIIWSGTGSVALTLLLTDSANTPIAGTTTTACAGTKSSCVDFNVTDLAYPGSRVYKLRVKNSNLLLSQQYTVTGSYYVTPTVGFELDDTTGALKAGSSIVGGIPRRSLSFTPPAGSNTYNFKMSSSDLAATGTLNETHTRLDFADVTLALTSGTSTLASARTSTGTASVPNYLASTGGPMNWVVTNNSPDLTADSTLSTSALTLADDVSSPQTIATSSTITRTVQVDAPGYGIATVTWDRDTLGYANVTLDVTGPSPSTMTVKSAGPSTTGNLSTAAFNFAAAGTYTVTVHNTSTGPTGNKALNAVITTTRPSTPAPSFSLQLKQGNTVVPSTVTTGKPTTISATVAAGNYTLIATPTSAGNATTTGTFPNVRMQYDGHDHATVIDDGHTTTSETLAASGRVLRRVVTDDTSHLVSEDTTLGYQDNSDSPAFSMPTGSTTIATNYIAGPGGLLVIDNAGTPTYPASNGHGDIIGTTDANGTFTTYPQVDEFGAGTPPTNRLGWLGDSARFSTGAGLNLIRMGVRLYDPTIGRFLETDPVFGGAANNYDYAYQDPVNGLDLNGRITCPDGNCRWDVNPEGNQHPGNWRPDPSASKPKAARGRGRKGGGGNSHAAVVSQVAELGSAVLTVAAVFAAPFTEGGSLRAVPVLLGIDAAEMSLSAAAISPGACRGQHIAGSLFSSGVGLFVPVAFEAVKAGREVAWMMGSFWDLGSLTFNFEC